VYRRSKTDSASYCPYCGKGFNMNRDRYWALYDARKQGRQYGLTSCKACHKYFYFMNCTPKFVRETGVHAVLKFEEAPYVQTV
jgi:hypothetical protein